MWTRGIIKEVEELIKIVGKGNLLEALFIFLGNFQHADLQRHMDHRNHKGLSEFINKKEQEPLDKHFNLKFSLQGLFLIYAQAYKILAENAQLNTQEVIDKIYEIIKRSELGKGINEVLNGRKLDLLNVLANPKRDPIFETVEDFEDKVLIDVRRLLSEENILNNKYDREFALNKCIIDFYYSIHQDIKVDKDIALFFSLGSHYKKLSSSNKTVKREVLEICEDPLIESYIMLLASSLHRIELSSRDGVIKYTVDYENMDWQEKQLNGLIHPINTKNTLGRLLNNQNSDAFEQLVTNPENMYYSVPQSECRLNSTISNKKNKNHKNTFCKLALGMFILSVGLYAADYFFMEQKLFNSITNILPQNNLINFIVAAVLTIVIVYALFQLLKSPQEPPHSAVNGAIINDLTNGPTQSRRS